MPKPSAVVAGRPLRASQGGGLRRRRRPGDMERKGLPAATGPISSRQSETKPRSLPGPSPKTPHHVCYCRTMHDTLLLFGATGDLARRYLFPSLRHLLRDRLLPDTFRVVAIGRTGHGDEGFRNHLRENLQDADSGNREALDDLLTRTRYHAID